MAKSPIISLIVTVLVANVSPAAQFVTVNEWTYRSDDPCATDVAFRVTMTFTPAADLGGINNTYEYSVENLTTDLTATLFRVANPDGLSGAASCPPGWRRRTGVKNFLWENGWIAPGETVGVFKILTPDLLPDLVTPPYPPESRGWIMTHNTRGDRVDVQGPIIHVPDEWPLEGTWIMTTPNPLGTLRSILTLDSQDPDRLRYTCAFRHVTAEPTLLGMFPEATGCSQFYGEVIKTGLNTYATTMIAYGTKTVQETPVPQIVWISVFSGEFKLIDADSMIAVGAQSIFLPEQDADGDGLPDDDQEPVGCLEYTGTARQLHIKPPCLP